MDPAHSTAALLDSLHRRHDGPLPREDMRTVRLGGMAQANAVRRNTIGVLHEGLAAEARLGIARRRRTLPGRMSIGDAWLSRLTATLAHHRNAAVAAAGALSGTRIPNRAPAPA